MMTLDLPLASRLATIALGHAAREFPNKLDHVLNGPEDAQSPARLHPVFYGSFDWHSCVHAYWLLATLVRLFPALPEADAIHVLFDRQMTPEKIALERAYLDRPNAGGFERPYGWAWLLMLAAELSRHDDARARARAAALQPLATAFVERFRVFLPRQTYPIRAGTHANSAFALSLAWDYAEAVGDEDLAELIIERARFWFERDSACQAWEPDGDAFLSPALMEAECMRRILHADEFFAWFDKFLPGITDGEPRTLFEPAAVSDPSDGKIAHLDGLNLSRAWCWRNLATRLDPLVCARALAAADRHLAASLPAVAGHYAGEHWLGTFALLALAAG